MIKRKQISLYIKENELELIDQAAKKESRTRSSFLTISAKERANEILKNE